VKDVGFLEEGWGPKFPFLDAKLKRRGMELAIETKKNVGC